MHATQSFSRTAFLSSSFQSLRPLSRMGRNYSCGSSRRAPRSNSLRAANRMQTTLSPDGSNGLDEKHEKFFQMEHRNWEKGYAAYDAGFGPLTRLTIPTLLQNSNFPPRNEEGNDVPYSLLDVATGPGFVLSAAVDIASSLPQSENSGKSTFQFTGIDISQNFLDLAEERVGTKCKQLLSPNHIDMNFLSASAESLPFPNNTFDCIVCNFGILHFFDPDAFIRESYRVLRPGGRLSFSAWSPPERTEGFGITLESISEVGNPNVDNIPEGPNFFRFGNHDEAYKTLLNSGFEHVNVTELSDMKWNNILNGAMLYDVLLNGTVRTKEILLGQTEEQALAVQLRVKEKYNLVTNGGRRPLSMPAVISSGQKPLST